MSYKILFQFKPTSYPTVTTNLFHLTRGGNGDDYGDRAPAVFFHHSQGLQFMSAVNGDKNYKPKPKPGQSTKKFFDLPNIGEWTALEIGQRHEENTEAFTFYVSINQTEVHSVLNTQPTNFSDMKVCINDKLTVITVRSKIGVSLQMQI